MADDSSIQVDKRGFVVINGVKVARYLAERHCLQFVNKDRRRVSKRGGSRLFEVSIDALADLGDNTEGKGSDVKTDGS